MSFANTFGSRFSWTTFGESHGTALGVVIDGCPAGLVWNEELLKKQLARRRPGQIDSTTQQVLVTDRQEEDRVEVLSGVFEGKTLGTPIACVVYNTNQKSEDYEKIKNNPRIGHADDVWKYKFGHVDHRGGGRASARETVARVIAGAVAQMYVMHEKPDLHLASFISQLGPLVLTESERAAWSQRWTENYAIDAYTARFPNQNQKAASELLIHAKQHGESYGGLVETWVSGVPVGLGEPVFDKLKSRLAYGMMSIGATCSFEIGDGKNLISQPGSQVHQQHTSSHYGGIRGGISTGDLIIFKVGFKPPSTIGAAAKEGRHDPCVIPRAIPIVEAMTWTILADFLLMQKSNNIFAK